MSNPQIPKGLPSLDIKKILSNIESSHVQGLTHSSFPLWVLTNKMKMDGNLIDFDHHRYLLPIYACNDNHIVWKKGSQLGATSMMLLKLLWYVRNFELNAALYFPTSSGVDNLSKGRLGPLIEENPELSKFVGKHHSKKAVENNALRQFRNIHGTTSTLYMLYLGGKASKDSVPLSICFYDELRLVSQKDVDQSLERLSGSNLKIKVFMSTAGMESDDIDARFKEGNQSTWVTKCLCPDGIILPEVFPDCVVEHKGEVYYRCPKCKARIWDNQNGNYIAMNPKADYTSFNVSQMNSSTISPKELWSSFKVTTNMMEYYNAKLARCFWSENDAGCSQEHLDACRNTDLKWAFEEPSNANKSGIAMGVDQHDSNLYVVIGKKHRNGFKQIIHYEIIDTDNPEYYDELGEQVSPFERLKKLIYDFNVSLAVIDAQPNTNEVKALCRAFPGRVFESYYVDSISADLVVWGDKIKMKESIRKGSREIKNKYTVKFNKYHSLDYLYKAIRDRNLQWPEPKKLTQIIRNKEGKFSAEVIFEERAYTHLKALIRNKKSLEGQKGPGKVGNTGKARYEWIFSGGDRNDPHSAHAMNYFNVAIERLIGRTPLLMI